MSVTNICVVLIPMRYNSNTSYVSASNKRVNVSKVAYSYFEMDKSVDINSSVPIEIVKTVQTDETKFDDGRTYTLNRFDSPLHSGNDNLIKNDLHATSLSYPGKTSHSTGTGLTQNTDVNKFKQQDMWSSTLIPGMRDIVIQCVH